jgi:hypothetical protein
MIFNRILMAMIALAAFSAGAAVGVVALAFAFYALLEPYLGRAGSAAAVAGTVTLLMIIVGVFIDWSSRRRAEKAAAALKGNLLERGLLFVAQKPVMAISAAVGAGLMAVRNPKYVGEAVRAFMDRKPRP